MKNSSVEIIKKGHKIETWNKNMEDEILKCALDPLYFIGKYVMIQHAKKGRMLFELYDYQKEMLTGIHDHRNAIILSSRQMGKCFYKTTSITYNNTKSKIENLVKTSIKQRIIEYLEHILFVLAK